MSLSFAGVPLVLPDRGGRLERFLAEYQCLDELRAFSTDACWQATNRRQGRSGFAAAVHMSSPNWPSPPAPKLNTLYWPTGAARWAWGLFLATQTQVTAILATMGVSSGGVNLNDSAGDLILRDDEGGVEVKAEGMHLITPRPISVPGVSATDEALWLLPIVDDRYFWQWADLGAIDAADVLDTASTWSDLWTLIEGALGKTITRDAVSADYFQPDPREFAREFQNLALLLDAAAASNGQRIVRKLDGTIRSIGATAAATGLTTNLDGHSLANAYRTIAGGDFSSTAPWSLRPEKVAVVFPRYDLGRPDCAGAVYGVEVTAASRGVASYRTAMTKTFFCTAFADYGGDAAAVTPDNASDLTTLATEIADDYYAWLAQQFDYTFAGLKRWEPTGCEDWTAWTWGRLSPCAGQDEAREATERTLERLVGQSEDRDELRELLDDLAGGGARSREYLTSTRVWSLPPNFGVEDLLNQFDLPVHDEWLIVQLTSALNPGSSATGKVMWKSGGSWVDAGFAQITVRDPIGTFTFEIGDRVEVHWHCQAREWQVVNGPC